MQHQWLGADAVGDWDLPNKPSPERFRLPSQTGKGKNPQKPKTCQTTKQGRIYVDMSWTVKIPKLRPW